MFDRQLGVGHSSCHKTRTSGGETLALPRSLAPSLSRSRPQAQWGGLIGAAPAAAQCSVSHRLLCCGVYGWKRPADFQHELATRRRQDELGAGVYVH